MTDEPKILLEAPRYRLGILGMLYFTGSIMGHLKHIGFQRCLYVWIFP